jgi:glycerol uptake facilitator-like aquaporin
VRRVDSCTVFMNLFHAMTAFICNVDKICVGGVFNPAIGIALPLVTGRHTGDIWVYVVGEFLGGILAAGLFLFVYYGTDVTTGYGALDEASKPLFDDGLSEYKI